MITRVFVFDISASKIVFINPSAAESELDLLTKLVQSKHRFDSLLNLERTEFNFNGVEHFTQKFTNALVGAAGISIGRNKRFLFKIFEILNHRLESFGIGHCQVDEFYELVYNEVVAFNQRTPDVSPTILARNFGNSAGRSPMFLRHRPSKNVEVVELPSDRSPSYQETPSVKKVVAEEQEEPQRGPKISEPSHKDVYPAPQNQPEVFLKENQIKLAAPSDKSGVLNQVASQDKIPLPVLPPSAPKRVTLTAGEVVMETERNIESVVSSKRSQLDNLVYETAKQGFPVPKEPASKVVARSPKPSNVGNDEIARSVDNSLMLDSQPIKSRVPSRDALFIAFTFFMISTLLLAYNGDRINDYLNGMSH
jgi:hypothetical protein